MSENFLLMDKDDIVMKINFDEGIYNVLNNSLLPYQLKGKELKIQIINNRDYLLNKSYDNLQNIQNNENIER